MFEHSERSADTAANANVRPGMHLPLAVAVILGMASCEQAPSSCGRPVWLPETAEIGMDGTAWEDAQCKTSASILWGFMDAPHTLGYLGADVSGTIQSVKRLYEILDLIDTDAHTLHDVEAALTILDTLIKNNIREDTLDSRKIREDVFAYGRKLQTIQAQMQRVRGKFFEHPKNTSSTDIPKK